MIKLQSNTRIEECAASGRYDEEQRPVLCGVYYDGIGTAVATDGFVLAAIPVEVEGDSDSSGIIPTPAIKAARRAAGRKNSPELDLSEPGTVSFVEKDGKPVTTPLTEGHFPDYKVVIPNIKPGDEGTVTIALNANNLMKVARALHPDGYVALTFQVDGEVSESPIKVYPLPKDYRGSLSDKDGMGVVMPMLCGWDRGPRR